jgi:hypothetical protein
LPRLAAKATVPDLTRSLLDRIHHNWPPSGHDSPP